ncbi:MAG TPA: hypothetical protein VN107_11290 [Microbacterium sp.]|nr:hypothetical protein [Microbacterium sp.]
MRVYKPSRAWLIANYTGASALVGLSLPLLFVPVGGVGSIGRMIALPMALLGGFVIARIPRIQAAYDDQVLHLNGFFRSVQIPRRCIRMVDTDPRSARVDWERPDGQWTTTTITAVAVGNRYVLPARTLGKQRAFLHDVSRWANRT